MFHKFFILILCTLPAHGLHNASRNGRIVGGIAATEGQFPYIVSLRRASMRHNCGGSIMSENWVLTAAHCLTGFTPATVFVVSGTIHLNNGVNPIRHSVLRFHRHENYNSETFAFDVATIRVREPFVWTKHVQPIPLNRNFISEGQTGFAMGWGLTTQDRSGDSSNILLWFSTTTISFDNCRRQHGNLIIQQHLCTFSRVGQGICSGDSGGPLVINNQVVGIASVVKPCARGYPDGWDRISTFYSWIRAHMVG